MVRYSVRNTSYAFGGISSTVPVHQDCLRKTQICTTLHKVAVCHQMVIQEVNQEPPQVLEAQLVPLQVEHHILEEPREVVLQVVKSVDCQGLLPLEFLVDLLWDHQLVRLLDHKELRQDIRLVRRDILALAQQVGSNKAVKFHPMCQQAIRRPVSQQALLSLADQVSRAIQRLDNQKVNFRLHRNSQHENTFLQGRAEADQYIVE